MLSVKTIHIPLLFLFVINTYSEVMAKENILEGKLKISGPEVVEGKYNADKRSKASIMRNIILNMSSMRQYYNLRLNEKGAFEGKIKVQFSINYNGDVYNSKVYNSTLNDSSLEAFVVNKIAELKYDKISKKKKDITVIYPFIFELKND